MQSMDENVLSSTLLRKMHHCIEAKKGHRISQANMATHLGISTRTYLEYLRGTNSPLAMRVLFDLLSMQDDSALLEIISIWRTQRGGDLEPINELHLLQSK
jgi:putative transcriptional regulator